MQSRLVLLIGMLCVCQGGIAQRQPPVAQGVNGARPTNLKPWVSRQTTFNIPFAVDLSQGSPAEVQLFVSQDAGRTWRFHASQPPGAKHFPFEASGDGGYWFSSRTIDPQRNVAPVEQLRPELHVIVDTQRPQLEFTATAGVAGEIKTAWRITDASLDPSSLKIAYQVAEGGQWRQVAVDSRRLSHQAGTLSGEMTWWPERPSAALSIRAEVADAAGNRAVVNRSVTRSRALAGVPVATGANPSVVPPNPYSAHYSAPAQAVPWTSERKPAAGDNRLAAGPTRNPSPPVDTEGAHADSNYSPVPSPTIAEQPQTDDQVRSTASPSSDADPSTTRLPDGERRQMTNSLHFQLDYELDAVGPEGVDEVQLWGTRDFGQTWTQWSLDEDRLSPLEIQVEEEGTYGFRVVIVGRNGLATPKPHAGDLADIWVGVDVTKPVARLASVLYGEGLHAGELEIRWQVSDDALGERPITLLFSEQAAGPWRTIAAGLPNSGQYFWRVDPNIPREIFLRIEVRDEAGNLAEQQLVEPISTRGLIPKAFIRSIRPVAPDRETNDGGRYR